MTLVDLFGVIEKTLAIQGFKLSEHFHNSTLESVFVLGDDLKVRYLYFLDEGYPRLYGTSIKVSQTYRRNDSSHNTSYYLAIYKWNRGQAQQLRRIKLMCSQTEPTLIRKIAAFAEDYKSFKQAQDLEAMVSDLLNKETK